MKPEGRASSAVDQHDRPQPGAAGGDGHVRVAVDVSACIGSGQCALSVPEVFDQKEDTGTVRLLAQRASASLAGRLSDAARSCPVSAITVGEL